MKVRVCPRGYTIVEVMVFLAVSGGLFISAAMLMSGQQQKTQFAQSIREIESQIQDVMNDVSTGYYANTNNFKCSAPTAGSRPLITDGSNEQGANEGCIFIGRVMQFTEGEHVYIYTVAGRRQYVSGLDKREVKDFDEARPTAIAPSRSNGGPSAIESKVLSYGLQVASMQYKSGAANTDIAAVGFFSSLGQYDNAGANLVSGAQQVNLLPINGTALNQNPLDAVEEINKLNNASPVNPDGGVRICFNSGSTNQHGIITIGGRGRQLSTTMQIEAGGCS
jgi:type II secretory pathway pseudopilin PulG